MSVVSTPGVYSGVGLVYGGCVVVKTIGPVRPVRWRPTLEEEWPEIVRVRREAEEKRDFLSYVTELSARRSASLIISRRNCTFVYYVHLT